MALKALLVGINAYSGTQPLYGCVNDVKKMNNLLNGRYGLAADRTRLLLDGAATKDAINAGLRWLAECDAGERNPVRLFHFSGHGVRVPDENGDEADGKDECLVPVDYQTAGYLYDDALKALYDSCGADTHLLLSMDCCHSGGNQRDLSNKVIYRTLVREPDEEVRVEAEIRAAAQRNRQQRDAFLRQSMRDMLQSNPGSISDDEIEQRMLAIQAKYEKQHYGIENVEGNTVLIAACRPDQKAGDAGFDDGNNGVLTYHLVQALAGGQLTYDALIQQIGRALVNTFDQVPQLECGANQRNLPFLLAAS
jgi:metacaspase-1